MLTVAEIYACDEPLVKPRGKGFIKQFHHFTYHSEGILICKTKKGDDEIEVYCEMVQAEEKIRDKFACGVCGDPQDFINDAGRSWVQCDVCDQWVHYDCTDFDEKVENDFYCSYCS